MRICPKSARHFHRWMGRSELVRMSYGTGWASQKRTRAMTINLKWFLFFFLNLSTLFRYLYSDEKNIFLFKIVQNSDYRRHMKNKKHITQNQHCKDHLFFVFEIVTRINTLNGNYNTFSSYFWRISAGYIFDF